MNVLVCSCCQMRKKLIEFCKNNKSLTGYHYKCKNCVHLYYLKNKEKELIWE